MKSLQDVFKSKLRFEEMRFTSMPNRTLATKVYFDKMFLGNIRVGGHIVDDEPAFTALLYNKYKEKWVKQWLHL